MQNWPIVFLSVWVFLTLAKCEAKRRLAGIHYHTDKRLKPRQTVFYSAAENQSARMPLKFLCQQQIVIPVSHCRGILSLISIMVPIWLHSDQSGWSGENTGLPFHFNKAESLLAAGLWATTGPLKKTELVEKCIHYFLHWMSQRNFFKRAFS